jgi:hypothetical protein
MRPANSSGTWHTDIMIAPIGTTCRAAAARFSHQHRQHQGIHLGASSEAGASTAVCSQAGSLGTSKPSGLDFNACTTSPSAGKYSAPSHKNKNNLCSTTRARPWAGLFRPVGPDGGWTGSIMPCPMFLSESTSHALKQCCSGVPAAIRMTILSTGPHFIQHQARAPAPSRSKWRSGQLRHAFRDLKQGHACAQFLIDLAEEGVDFIYSIKSNPRTDT